MKQVGGKKILFLNNNDSWNYWNACFKVNAECCAGWILQRLYCILWRQNNLTFHCKYWIFHTEILSKKDLDKACYSKSYKTIFFISIRKDNIQLYQCLQSCLTEHSFSHTIVKKCTSYLKNWTSTNKSAFFGTS